MNKSFFHERIIIARKPSLGQGNIFTSMCQEFCSEGGCLVPGLGGLLPGVPGPVRGVCSQGGAWWRPPMATAAGSTHPTGMHSCFTHFNT